MKVKNFVVKINKENVLDNSSAVIDTRSYSASCATVIYKKTAQ